MAHFNARPGLHLALTLMILLLCPISDSGSAARFQSAAVIRAAAENYLAALTPDQLLRVRFEFGSEERTNWHFVPRARKGLSFRDMDSAQQRLAHAFLSSALSQRGYIKAATIMSLEAVLRELEQGRGPERNPDLYYFSVFGEPSDSRTWGWRIEGHHLSLNFTLAEGRLVASTPAFYGSNPAEVREGPRKGLRVLREEEDRARALLLALEPEKRALAVISERAPSDIVTANHLTPDIGPPVGLPASRMNPRQRDLLLGLIEEYAGNMPADVAAARMEQVRGGGIDKVFFAWAGGTERGMPHYYRVHGPAFLIEYDNTQNNANHIHSVWRNLAGDFGADLLGAHLRDAHAKGIRH